MNNNQSSPNEKELEEEKRWEEEQKKEEKYILDIQAKYPIGNEPYYVLVKYSEYKAFYHWNDYNWEKNGQLKLSIMAADIIFDHFDKIVHEKKAGEGGYDKLGYYIIETKTGNEILADRYDLGDLNGGLFKWLSIIKAPLLKKIRQEKNSQKEKPNNIIEFPEADIMDFSEENIIDKEELEDIEKIVTNEYTENTNNEKTNYDEPTNEDKQKILKAMIETLEETYNTKIFPITNYEFAQVNKNAQDKFITQLAQIELEKKITNEAIKEMKKTELYKKTHIHLVIKKAFSNIPKN